MTRRIHIATLDRRKESIERQRTIIKSMRREIEVLASLKIRPGDNDPKIIKKARKIAVKYTGTVRKSSAIAATQ